MNELIGKTLELVGKLEAVAPSIWRAAKMKVIASCISGGTFGIFLLVIAALSWRRAMWNQRDADKDSDKADAYTTWLTVAICSVVLSGFWLCTVMETALSLDWSTIGVLAGVLK
jgi:uncharacterized membrane protein YidH (DUF202 family)